MILNILNHNSGHADTLDQCLAQLAEGDSMLFIEDGVLATLDTANNQQWLALCPTGIKLYVLREDLDARGLANRVLPEFKQVDYGEWVDLVASNPLSQSWF